jgi:hypothetical protein
VDVIGLENWVVSQIDQWQMLGLRPIADTKSGGHICAMEEAIHFGIHLAVSRFDPRLELGDKQGWRPGNICRGKVIYQCINI